jgi:hypothetical protein
MPPQKNSGNKGAKRETGASSKNRRFVNNLFDDLKTEGTVEHVHIARVIRRLGDGRMEVFYTEKANKTGEMRGKVAQAVIRGSFRGRGKHSVWIDVGSFVAIVETGVAGSSALEISGVISPEQMRELAKEVPIDPRILAVDATDAAQLLSSKMSGVTSGDTGYEFDTIAEDDDEDLDVDGI